LKEENKTLKGSEVLLDWINLDDDKNRILPWDSN
jgi:hypothetical protein